MWMLHPLHLEQFWHNQVKETLITQYILLVESCLSLRRTIILQKGKVWLWYIPYRSSDIIYWVNILRCLQIIPALKYLVNKPVLGGRICRWLLLFQEYDFEIIVKPGKLNAGPDHLSRITNGEEPKNLEENFPDANLFSIQIVDDYFADIVGFLSTGMAPKEFTVVQKK
jgi:hypothetical protein